MLDAASDPLGQLLDFLGLLQSGDVQNMSVAFSISSFSSGRQPRQIARVGDVLLLMVDLEHLVLLQLAVRQTHGLVGIP